MLPLLLGLHGPLSCAQTFVPTTVDDSIDAAIGDGVCADVGNLCSLRAAVMEANALPGRQRIDLPPGTYQLALEGAHENASLTGDLDILDTLDLAGAGDDASVIDAAGIDRVIDIAPDGTADVSVTVAGISIVGGVRSFSPSAEARGGGIRIGASGRLDLMEAVVLGNSANASGGGVQNAGQLLVQRSRIEENVLEGAGSSGTGAGLATGGNDAAFAHLIDTTVRGNHGANRGGAIAVVRGDDLPGGLPVIGFGQLLIEHSALIDNQATHGGAFYADAPGTFTIRNSTVSGNHGSSSGGLFIDNVCTTRIEFSTITGNFGTVAGGIMNVHGPVRPELHVTGSILAANHPSDIRGPMESGGHNLVEVDGAAPPWVPAAGDQIGTAAALGPLQMPSEGAPFHEPDSASLAIDAAHGACPATDQRHMTRPADGNDDGIDGCDIGAIERGATDVIFADGFDPSS